MKLSHIFEGLASGELANLNLAEDRINIKEDKKVIVMRNINAALRDIHTRFMLRKNVAVFVVDEVTNLYEIVAEDFVEIIAVSVNGTELKDHEYKKISTESFSLNIKLGILDYLSVEYKASHRVLTELDIQLDSEVILPYSYLNALLYFVASRLYAGAVNQLDGDLNEGVTYARKYQDEVMLLLSQGIDVDGLEEHNSFRSRGFI